ncbi:MAG TPA: ABC transporter ATP-binding protein [Thermoplasmata archaeon]|nr:ABC transporter ATP-binding protein [Thermoplasmata archaeon]
MTDPPTISIQGLSIDYVVGAGRFRAVSDVSLDVPRGHVVGIVGETGCGKSTLAQAIPRLLPEPPATIGGGRILFEGIDLVKIPMWKMPLVRGTGISMIFQEPLNSLNPAFRIYDQVAEAVHIRRLRDQGKAGAARMDKDATGPFDYSKRPAPTLTDAYGGRLLPGGAAAEKIHRTHVEHQAGGDVRELKDEVLDYLKLVRINDPETILNLYPHELSGGMRQRVMIAMALCEKPKLLIADEPTSALDVTIQAQVLTLMKELIQEVNTTILFISHDLGVIAETADELGVMYAGKLVEFGPVGELFDHPKHPYTKALLRAAPTRYKSEGPLRSISGNVPNLSRPPPGCRFHPRCPIAQDNCKVAPGPPLAAVAGASANHTSACFYPNEVEGIP